MTQAPLKLSPIHVHYQNFLSVNVQATLADSFAAGDIQVERIVKKLPERENCWSVYFELHLKAIEGQPLPPYTGNIIAEGVYEVLPNYPNDPESLVRVTGCSMLYGALRELVSTITARGPNGMVTLPSVSFVEDAPLVAKKKSSASKVLKKVTKSKSKPA